MPSHISPITNGPGQDLDPLIRVIVKSPTQIRPKYAGTLCRRASDGAEVAIRAGRAASLILAPLPHGGEKLR